MRGAHPRHRWEIKVPKRERCVGDASDVGGNHHAAHSRGITGWHVATTMIEGGFSEGYGVVVGQFERGPRRERGTLRPDLFMGCRYAADGVVGKHTRGNAKKGGGGAATYMIRLGSTLSSAQL